MCIWHLQIFLRLMDKEISVHTCINITMLCVFCFATRLKIIWLILVNNHCMWRYKKYTHLTACTSDYKLWSPNYSAWSGRNHEVYCNKAWSWKSLRKKRNIPYPTAFPYGNDMVLHFYQQQESSTTKTVHKVINKGLKTYV